MISKIKGKLILLNTEFCTLDIPPFEYDVFLPEFTRRQLQSKVNQEISLHTFHYFDGNPAQGGKMTPRLIGFTTEIEREFFELFCSVDGLGAKKALRAMVRPVQEVAALIEEQDSKGLSALPGIGPATADRIVAKLRRKMPKFALLVAQYGGEDSVDIDRDVVAETYQVLLSLGHNEADVQKLIDNATKDTKKKFKDVEALLQAVYQHRNQ